MIMVKVVKLNLRIILKQKQFEYLVPFWNYWPSYDVTLDRFGHFFLVFYLFRRLKVALANRWSYSKLLTYILGAFWKKIEYLVPFWNYWPSYDVRHFLQCVLDILLFMCLTVTFSIKMIIVKVFKLYLRSILKKNYLNTLSRFETTDPVML